MKAILFVVFAVLATSYAQTFNVFCDAGCSTPANPPTASLTQGGCNTETVCGISIRYISTFNATNSNYTVQFFQFNDTDCSATTIPATFRTETLTGCNAVSTVYSSSISFQLSSGSTPAPTSAPTEAPTSAPSTATPTNAPTTETPTNAPTTETPTNAPTTETPTNAPTTATPSSAPATATPTSAPTTATPTTATPTTATPTTATPTTATPSSAPATATPSSAPTTATPAPTTVTVTIVAITNGTVCSIITSVGFTITCAVNANGNATYTIVYSSTTGVPSEAQALATAQLIADANGLAVTSVTVGAGPTTAPTSTPTTTPTTSTPSATTGTTSAASAVVATTAIVAAAAVALLL